MREFCRGGRRVSAVAATRGDLDALERAAQPVYTELEDDPDTKALIAEYPHAQGRVTRASGGRPTGAVHADDRHRERPEAVPVGRQRHLSLAGDRGRRGCGGRAVGASPNADDEDIGTIGKMTLRDGKWLMGDATLRNTPAPTRSSATGSCSTGKATSSPSSSLATPTGRSQLEPLPPMNRGDAAVWAGGPWRRVGPPVRDIP